jgi:hypothetical protein
MMTKTKAPVWLASLAAAAAFGLSLAQPAPARAQGWFMDMTDIVYYWEVERPRPGMAAWGWSRSPGPFEVSGPAVRRRGEDMWSFCARQVGRMMRTDRSDQVRSVALTDGCVRRGGRI